MSMIRGHRNVNAGRGFMGNLTSKDNSNGISWTDWLNAAGITVNLFERPTVYDIQKAGHTKLLIAWRVGEDPTEYRV